MLDVSVAAWAATIGAIVVLFALDLFVSRPGHAHAVGFRVENNHIVGAVRRVIPVTDSYAGGRMLTRAGGRRVATPLFIVFVAISSSDLLLDRLVYLSTGLSLILAFIGVKLLLHFGHLQDDSIPEVQTSTSLAVIVAILVITVVASLLRARRDPDVRAHAGSLRDTRKDQRT